MSEVTRILSQIEQDDPQAAQKLLPLVYDELRKLAAARMAQENPGQTLQATALVHEAYLRLVDAQNSKQWDNRGHFFVAAAEAMRRILIENARRKKSRKGGGGFTRVDLEEAHLTINPEPEDLLTLDDSLAKLAAEDGPAAAVAKLRLYAGMTVDEAADSLGISRTTGFRHWTYARAFLQAELLSAPPSQEN
jgi:RNA polymerase sigma factor (TIGR02999 family)